VAVHTLNTFDHGFRITSNGERYKSSRCLHNYFVGNFEITSAFYS
jgi:hypothetical protein